MTAKCHRCSLEFADSAMREALYPTPIGHVMLCPPCYGREMRRASGIACEHLWSAWEISGETRTASEVVARSWKRRCSMCGAADYVSRHAGDLPPAETFAFTWPPAVVEPKR